jgi:hypothetical protein
MFIIAAIAPLASRLLVLGGPFGSPAQKFEAEILVRVDCDVMRGSRINPKLFNLDTLCEVEVRLWNSSVVILAIAA